MFSRKRQAWQQRDVRAGGLVIAAGVGVVGFVALAIGILFTPALISLDMRLSEAIRSLSHPLLDGVARFATHVGDFWPMVALTGLTALLMWLRGRRTSAVTLVAAVLSGSAFGAVLKLIIARARPALEVARIPIPETYSFPSGHALASLLFFGSVAFLVILHEESLRKSVAVFIACLLAALTIAFARVYLGVHYLGDVVGSWFLGIGWLALVIMVSARWGASSADGDVTGPAAG